MSITIDQIIQDAQRIANRVKDLEALGNALLVEAEGNNRQIETMKQFQDDIDSLNKLARDKSNAEMVNRINQQNPGIREIRQENRELKATLEDHQRTLELIMQKYREHTQHKILSSRINFKDLCNAKNAEMSEIIRKQAEKITEMAAVMQSAAAADDDIINEEIECVNRLRIENEGLKEMLQISKQFGSCSMQIGCEDKAVQTDEDVAIDQNVNSIPDGQQSPPPLLQSQNQESLFVAKESSDARKKILKLSTTIKPRRSKTTTTIPTVSSSESSSVVNGEVENVIQDEALPTAS